MDYNSGSYTVQFDAGVTRVSFNISINNDNIMEGNESFTLNINPSLPSSVTIGDHNQTTVTILANDGKYICRVVINILPSSIIN